MNIQIYTKENCSYCIKAKNLLKNKNLEYTEIKINIDISLEDFKNKFPEVKTVPYIIINDSVIGGYSELEKIL